MTTDDDDLLAQLGKIAREESPSAAELALADLDPSAAEIDSERAQRLAARAAASEAWAEAVRASGPLEPEARAAVLDKVLAAAAPEISAPAPTVEPAPACEPSRPDGPLASARPERGSRPARRAVRWVAGTSSALAAGVALFLMWPRTTNLPEYGLSTADGSPTLTWPVDAAGGPLAAPRSPAVLVLTPDVATTLTPKVSAFAGPNQVQIRTEIAGTGAIRVRILDAAPLADAKALTVLIAKEDLPRRPEDCQPPACRTAHIPVKLQPAP